LGEDVWVEGHGKDGEDGEEVDEDGNGGVDGEAVCTGHLETSVERGQVG